jgi:hypothetical protein
MSLPSLSYDSFLGPSVRLQSSIEINKSAVKVWCQVAVCDADFSELALHMFESHFPSEGAWRQAAGVDTVTKFDSNDLTSQLKHARI